MEQQIHDAIQKALRQVSQDDHLPSDARLQAKRLLANLAANHDEESAKRPSKNRMIMSRCVAGSDRIWKIFEVEYLDKIKQIHKDGFDSENAMHVAAAETAITVALAELLVRANMRLVDDLEAQMQVD